MSVCARIIPVLTVGREDIAQATASLASLLAAVNGGPIVVVDHRGVRPDPGDLDGMAASRGVCWLSIGHTARSTARNRALHYYQKTLATDGTTGGTMDWIWLLDPGDTLGRHAVQVLQRALEATATPPGLVIPVGLTDARDRLPAQLGAPAWERRNNPADVLISTPRHEAALVPPWAALRLVRADLITRYGLRCADDQGGGDLLWSVGALLAAPSIAHLAAPVVSLAARATGDGFARLRDATRALAALTASPTVNDPDTRLAIMAMLAQDLETHASPLSHEDRTAFQNLVALMLARAAPELHWSLDPNLRQPSEHRLRETPTGAQLALSPLFF